MTWPASDVNTTNSDADSDSPLSFRPDVQDLITKFNQMRNHASAFIQTLLDDANAATARGTLGSTATGDALFTAASAAAARTTLGVSATGADTTYNVRASNLSDVASPSSARGNLGVTATGADTTYNYRANNLSDVANAVSARSNLGLGAIAVEAGGLVLVTKNTPAAAASSSFSSLDQNTRYKIVIRVRWNTSNGYLKLRFNTDSGANYGFDFHTIDWNGSAGSNFTAGTATEIPINNTVAPVIAGGYVMAEIEFVTDPSDTTIVAVQFRSSFKDTNSRHESNHGGGQYDGASALTAVSLTCSAGTITGDVWLYRYS